MASEHAYNPAPPPSPRLPPPPPSPHPAHLQAPQISPRRFAVQPPLLNTTLAPPQPSGPSYLHGSTPATASSLSLPFSPSHTPSAYAPSPVAAASPMAMRGSGPAAPYNPQQWSRGANVGGQHLQHAQISGPSRLQDVTGMEGIYLYSLVPASSFYVANLVNPFSFLSRAWNQSCAEHDMPLCILCPVSSLFQHVPGLRIRDANSISIDALTTTPILSWPEPKHLTVP